VVLYGDLLFRTYILNNLMDWEADLLVVVDSSPLDQVQGNKNDLAYCSAPDDRAMYQQKVTLEQISNDAAWSGRQPDGRWIGMLRARGAGRNTCSKRSSSCGPSPVSAAWASPTWSTNSSPTAIAPQVQYITGHWMDINNLEDLQRAGDFAHGQA
jgi:phosphoenolpyruvate phosphomutase